MFSPVIGILTYFQCIGSAWVQVAQYLLNLLGHLGLFTSEAHASIPSGGVFATLIDDTGISIYRFDRGSIPSDIEAGTPDPSSWGVATAMWSSSTCDISSHFTDMSIVWDITLCGGWAGDAFSKTCSGTCSDAVKDPENFTVAKWKINYVAIYQ